MGWVRGVGGTDNAAQYCEIIMYQVTVRVPSLARRDTCHKEYEYSKNYNGHRREACIVADHNVDPNSEHVEDDKSIDKALHLLGKIVHGHRCRRGMRSPAPKTAFLALEPKLI